MNIKYTHTRLLVSDFKGCFRFYRDVLGFQPAYGTEDGSYADFETGEVDLALFDKEEMSKAVGTANQPARAAIQDGVCLIFKVDSVDEMYRQLAQKGVAFVAAPADRADWGIRTAHFRDPAGNLIEVYQDLKQEGK